MYCGSGTDVARAGRASEQPADAAITSGGEGGRENYDAVAAILNK